MSVKAFPYTESNIRPADKLKGILLFMWRMINRRDKAVEAVNERSRCESVKGKGGDLNICGSAQLNIAMLEQWRADNFRDYLTPDETQEEGGRAVLRRIINKSKSADVDDIDINFDEDEENGLGDEDNENGKVRVTGKQLRDLISQRPEIADILYQGLR